MLLRALALCVGFFVWCATPAVAEGLQAQCGSQTGKGYALRGGVVQADRAGWYEDAMRGEVVIRIDTTSGEVDVRFKDATQVWASVKDEGGTATLFATEVTPPSFMVVVAYPGKTIEVLTIGEIEDGTATLVHSLSRALPKMANSRIMTASCTVTAF